MSHRKFEAPRHGSLGYSPRKRSRTHRGVIRSFPPDDATKPPHLTAFMGYKAGMTHIVRDLDKIGSKMHKREVVEAVSIVEAPPMVVIGLVGYTETPRGLRALSTVWAQHLGEEAKRRFQKGWAMSKKKSFTKYAKLYSENPAAIEKAITNIRKHAKVVRVIAHTQVRLIKAEKSKRAHVMEIQINGGSVNDKVDFARNLFEKHITVDSIFTQDEMLDIIAVNKGHGFKGVISRFHVRKLPRKTHKGLRKVACIGAWHPARVSWAVPRAGQKGYHHRTQVCKKVYRIGKALKREGGKFVHDNASTEYDITKKSITPIGGFNHYGIVKYDYVMIKGSITGPARRPITLRKSLIPRASRSALEKIDLKFIDTSANRGTGRFQTTDEKQKFLGPMKPRRKPPTKKGKKKPQEKKEKKEADKTKSNKVAKTK